MKKFPGQGISHPVTQGNLEKDEKSSLQKLIVNSKASANDIFQKLQINCLVSAATVIGASRVNKDIYL